MASKMLAVFLVGTMLSFLGRSDALSCVSCAYDSLTGADATCGTANTANTYATADCGSGHAYDTCSKIYTTYALSGRVTIQRGCGYNYDTTNLKAATNECYSYTQRGVTTTYCNCITDACNSAFRDVSPLPVLMLAATLLATTLLHFK